MPTHRGRFPVARGMLPKKRCSVCRKMFRPDPRVGDRQYACGEERCQHQRRAKTQASWRWRNRSYQSAYRLKRRSAEAAAAAAQRGGKRAGGRPSDPPDPLRLPPDLRTFPWDLAEAELGFAGADLLAVLAMLVVRLVKNVKDQKLVEKPLSMQVYAATGRDP